MGLCESVTVTELKKKAIRNENFSNRKFTSTISVIYPIVHVSKGDQNGSTIFGMVVPRGFAHRAIGDAVVQPTRSSKLSTVAGGGDASLRLELSDAQKRAMLAFWRETIAVSARDIFHYTMLFCIEASPKLNEIIACGHYCFRDLTKWPKLNRICQAQYKFFERILIEWEFEEARVRDAALHLGATHSRYAAYGLKSHFLDIFQQQFIGLVQRNVNARNMTAEENNVLISGFTTLTGFVIDVMNVGHSQALKFNGCPARTKQTST